MTGGSLPLRRLMCTLVGALLALSIGGAVLADDITRSTAAVATADPVGELVLFSEDFDGGPGDFDYVDDTFRGTDNANYARGHWLTVGGDGTLLVKLGGRDNVDVDGMSGGWKIQGVLPAPMQMTLRFRWALYQTPHYESDEYSQMLVRVNDELYGMPPNDYVAQIAGDGNGGGWVGTGWQTFEVDLGVLPAGPYSTVIGAYNNRKTFYNESTWAFIDDIEVIGAPGDPGDDQDNDGVADADDNCPGEFNPEQENDDGDDNGNACDDCPNDADDDIDDDGWCADEDNCPTVYNPGQDAEACDGMAHILIVDQDIRDTTPEISQHRQQPTSRIGVRMGVTYRTLGWFDVASIPADAIIDSVTVMYYTTSGDPLNIDNNGDTPPLGDPVTAELRQLLKPWNFDEPLTYPEDNTDNEPVALDTETSWQFSTRPDEWSMGGADSATDSGAVLAMTVIASTTDTAVAFSDALLVPMVQGWVDDPSTNYGFMIRASDLDEASETDNRKVLAGKGFPLETSTDLTEEQAISHRPLVWIEYHLPGD